jgi:hypothetical protein
VQTIVNNKLATLHKSVNTGKVHYFNYDNKMIIMVETNATIPTNVKKCYKKNLVNILIIEIMKV